MKKLNREIIDTKYKVYFNGVKSKITEIHITDELNSYYRVLVNDRLYIIRKEQKRSKIYDTFQEAQQSLINHINESINKKLINIDLLTIDISDLKKYRQIIILNNNINYGKAQNKSDNR